VIEPRIYRAAFLPALLALIVLAFSLEARPEPLPQALAADVLFQGRSAAAGAAQIAAALPDRRPGTVGDRKQADEMARTFSQRGFTTVVDRFAADDGTPLVNVIGRRAGASRHQIVVVAARDAGSVPDATGSAADTAALIEIAQVLQGTPSRKTIVLASVDGSTLGELGVHRLLSRLPDRDKIEAVLVMSNLAAPGPRVPPLETWSNGSQRVGAGLEGTAASSESEEFGSRPGESGAAAQMIRLAFPLGIGAQGPLLEGGADAVRFSASGELPPPSAGRGISAIDPNRLGSLGRSVLRTVFAIDATARAPRGAPSAYITVAHKLVPGWALALLAITLILPALVASIDAFARARRRREPAERYARWVLTGVLALVTGLVVAKLMVVVGIVASPPESPVAPELRPLRGGDVAVLAVVAAVVAVGLLGSLLALGRGPRRLDLAGPGAGCAVAVVLSFLSLAVWFVDPYAALMLVPALHLWLIAATARVPGRGTLPAALVLLGLAPLAAVALFYMHKLSLDPLHGLWYVFLLVTSGAVGVAAALIACGFVGVFACLVAIVVARARRPPAAKAEEPRRPPVFGPGGYAGPGALGGTESALRR
jgi:Peptidase family M28